MTLLYHLLLLCCPMAWGATPTNLEDLVVLALDRHPEVAALDSDADAARAQTSAAGRLMDPQWMLGVQALGAMPDSADPTMGMVGIEQMFSMPSVYTASRRRAALDVRWAEAERAVVAADVREALWEAAARLRAQSLQLQSLEEQISAAKAALAFGRVRYGAGDGAASVGGTGGGSAPEMSVVSLPIVVVEPTRGGMSGMGAKGGMSGGGMTGGTTGGMTSGTMGGMTGTTGMTDGMTGGMSGAAGMGSEGLAALLRLDAEVARVEADRDALIAKRDGEIARLSLIVGEEAAQAVASDPQRFLGSATPPSVAPERALAATSVEMAEADLNIARAGRLPTLMVATDVRIMPEGMVDGVDVALGVTIPIWGGARARVDAATATTEATSRRSEQVDRGLADALLAAQADEAAAEARRRALVEVARPRAHAAWEATLSVWAAGGSSTADLIAAWQTEVNITRDTAEAELAAELARARRARLEGR